MTNNILESLPPELLFHCFQHVERGSLRQSRTVSRLWRHFVDPVCFEALSIDLSKHTSRFDLEKDLLAFHRVLASARRLRVVLPHGAWKSLQPYKAYSRHAVRSLCDALQRSSWAMQVEISSASPAKCWLTGEMQASSEEEEDAAHVDTGPLTRPIFHPILRGLAGLQQPMDIVIDATTLLPHESHVCLDVYHILPVARSLKFKTMQICGSALGGDEDDEVDVRPTVFEHLKSITIWLEEWEMDGSHTIKSGSMCPESRGKWGGLSGFAVPLYHLPRRLSHMPRLQSFSFIASDFVHGNRQQYNVLWSAQDDGFTITGDETSPYRGSWKDVCML